MLPDSPPSLVTHEEVMFFDTDAGGVVHNLAYLRFIETCRTRLAVQMGMDMRAMIAAGEAPVVIRTEIEYRRPGRLIDRIEVRGQLESIGSARFGCRFVVRRPSDEADLAVCRQSLALVNLTTGRPMRLPAEWAAKWPSLVAAR